MPLNIFPVRAAIGRAELPDGTILDIFMSPEFARALSNLTEQIGGSNGMDTASIELLAGYQPAQMPVVPVDPGAILDQVQQIPAAPIDSGAFLGQIQEMLDQALAALNASRIEVSNLVQRIEGLELQLQPIPTSGVDWSRPGSIGASTANTGVFTTLNATTVTASDQITATGAYNVAPAIKAISPSVNIASTFAATNSAASQFLVGYSGSTADLTQAIYWNAGQTLRFATATDTQAAGFTVVATLSVSGFKSVAGLGCNGKVPQTAFALGAAATDLPTVIVLANNIRTALINNGIGS